jgi:lipid A 4'-phosphatase
LRNSDVIAEIALMLTAVLAGFAAFAALPEVDLWVSGQFYATPGGFVLQGQPVLEFVRASLWNASILLAVVALGAMMVGWRLRRAVFGVPMRVWGFVVALYLLAPGLLVNGILKRDWGRARPAYVQDFGGDARFTLPHQITDQCATNCSFVSGEVAGATALCICILVMLPYVRMGSVWRKVTVAIALALPVISAAQRIAAGRHFLSDALFAALFTAISARLLWHTLKPAAR